MTHRHTYIFAGLYGLMIGSAMLWVLIGERAHSGNHWSMFGTPIDRLFQSMGRTAIVGLALPPGIVAGLFALRGHWRWTAALTGLCLTLLAVANVFALTVLD